ASDTRSESECMASATKACELANSPISICRITSSTFTATLTSVLLFAAVWRSGSTGRLMIGPCLPASADAHARLCAGPGLQNIQAVVDAGIVMAGRQHHAFGDTETHLARRQIGNQHGQLIDEVGGLVSGLDA